jgi:hypothetical protein
VLITTEGKLTVIESSSSDMRQCVYCCEVLEEGRTHDDLWTAAQQVVLERRMHGSLRNTYGVPFDSKG